MTPAVLHILISLASEGPLYGFRIKEEVEERTGGELRLGPGTLYEGIHRLEAAGWICEADRPADGGGRKRYYRITEEGRTRMEEELERLAKIVRFAERELLIPGDSA